MKGAEELEGRELVRGPAADLWRHTLDRIPTVFGKLVYLASLRNQNTGLYEHFGLAQIFGEKEADGTLRANHAQLFAEWLCRGLEHQKEEVTGYLESLESELSQVVSNWLRLAPYRNFIPAEARQAERELYLADLETILEMLRYESGAASPDPDA
jgi:hypothetical protein